MTFLFYRKMMKAFKYIKGGVISLSQILLMIRNSLNFDTVTQII